MGITYRYLHGVDPFLSALLLLIHHKDVAGIGTY
jgi:hypothetical protein